MITKTKLLIVAYKITEPASEKKADPTPFINPSFFISIALDVIECAKPVVGIIRPDLHFFTRLSNIPIAVKKDAIIIIDSDIMLLMLNVDIFVILFKIKNTNSHNKPRIPPYIKPRI